MNVTSENIIKQTSQLSANEKIELIDALLATVDKPDAAIDALWAKEAEYRLTAHQNGEIQALNLNQVLDKYR